MARISFRNGGRERAEGRKPNQNPISILTGEQVADFTAAAQRPGIDQRTMDTIRRYLNITNSRRFKRLQADFRWVQGEMIKMDLNPEDARFIL